MPAIKYLSQILSFLTQKDLKILNSSFFGDSDSYQIFGIALEFTPQR